MENYSYIKLKYGINDNITKVEEIANGYYIQADDCNYYVPKNCSSSTNGVIFYHGAGGWKHDTGRVVDHINDDIDSVIIFPKEQYGFNYNKLDLENARLNSNLEGIMNHVGADTGNVTTLSFSAGDAGAVQGIAYNIQQHPEIKGQVCVLVDPKADQTGHGGERLMYNNNSYMKNSQEDTIRLLSENQATLIVYEQDTSLKDSLTLANYERFARAGVNVIMIGGPSEHVQEFQTALDNNLLSYVSGDYSKLGSLNSANMIKFDFATGSWVQASPQDIVEAYGGKSKIISKKADLTEEYVSTANFEDFTARTNSLKSLRMFTAQDISADIKSDSDYIASKMNEIRNIISSTTSLEKIVNVDCSSTTSVPTCAKDYLYSYFESTLTLLEKIALETEKVINYGVTIDELDKNLSKQANDIGVGASIPNDNTSYDRNQNTLGYISYPTPAIGGNSNDNISESIQNRNEFRVQEKTVEGNVSKGEGVISSSEFVSFDEIYTDNDKLVYNYLDNCKLIINHKGENVTGIFYYFDLENCENAINTIDRIKDEFSNMEGFSQIIQNDRYIKVLFSDSYASKFSMDEIRSKCSNLEKVIRG